MNYRSVEEARDLPGLRLVLSMGAPGPWGEAAKSIFHVKAIPCVAVGQLPGMPNDELEAAAAAPKRVADILRMLAGQLAEQRERGHEFLVGGSLSAADIYWATFAALVGPMPDDLCPLPGYLRASYANVGDVVGTALDPALLAHSDRIYRNYLQLPMSF
jgi:glutathione S-transferase